MRTLIVSLLFLAGIAMYIFWRTRRDQGIRRKTIAVADVGEVFRQISAQGVETSFAVFAIRTGDEDEDDSVEIQFSVEDGKTGFLVTPGDRQGLEDHLCQLLADGKLRRAMGLRANRAAATYDWDVVARDTLDVYKSALFKEETTWLKAA